MGSIKRRTNLGLKFGSFNTTQRTIQRYVAMHMLCKGQIKKIIIFEAQPQFLYS